MTLFTPEAEQRIAAAITQAERKTSGEILAVVAPRSDSYLYVPFLVASLVALLVPWPFIYLTWHPMQWVFMIQLVTFGLVLLALLPGDTRLLFVPRSVKRMHAHRRAMEQFLVQNLHTSDGRTGVLIFVSLAERYAEVVADHAIGAKVSPETWQRIVDGLTGALAQNRPQDGFVAVIEACGRELAAHFPPGTSDANQFPNHLIVLK